MNGITQKTVDDLMRSIGDQDMLIDEIKAENSLFQTQLAEATARVGELEDALDASEIREIEINEHGVDAVLAEATRADTRIAKLEKVVKWYGDEGNYHLNYNGPGCNSKAHADKGQRARDVLDKGKRMVTDDAE